MFVTGILDRWRTLFFQDFGLSEFAARFLDGFASHIEPPAMSIVEEENEFFARTKNVHERGCLNARIAGVGLLTDVGKQGVFFFARTRPAKFVVEPEAVIQIKVHRPDDRFCKVFQSVLIGMNKSHGK